MVSRPQGGSSRETDRHTRMQPHLSVTWMQTAQHHILQRIVIVRRNGREEVDGRLKLNMPTPSSHAQASVRGRLNTMHGRRAAVHAAVNVDAWSAAYVSRVSQTKCKLSMQTPAHTHMHAAHSQPTDDGQTRVAATATRREGQTDKH